MSFGKWQQISFPTNSGINFTPPVDGFILGIVVAGTAPYYFNYCSVHIPIVGGTYYASAETSFEGNQASVMVPVQAGVVHFLSKGQKDNGGSHEFYFMPFISGTHFDLADFIAPCPTTLILPPGRVLIPTS